VKNCLGKFFGLPSLVFWLVLGRDLTKIRLRCNVIPTEYNIPNAQTKEDGRRRFCYDYPLAF